MKLTLTARGLDFLRKCMQGGPSPEFRKIVFGKGDDAGDSASEMSNPVKEIDICSITRKEDYVTLVGVLNNTEIAERFKATELGVYITDPNVSGGMILYAYGHAPENEAALIPSATDYLIETEETIFVYVGTIDNVTAILSESSLFASKNDLNSHINDFRNPHNVTPGQIGMSAQDISNDFIVGSTETMSAFNIKVFKQGNIVLGSMTIGITADKAGDEECYLTIEDRYKPLYDLRCPLLGSSNLKSYLTISDNRIDYGDTNSTVGNAVISFAYMSGTAGDSFVESSNIWIGTKDEYNSLSKEQKLQHDVHFIEEGS